MPCKKGKTSETCSLRMEYMWKAAIDASSPIKTDYGVKNQRGTEFSPEC